MIKEKVKTYLGFAIKSGAVVWGIDNILKKRNIKLILISDNLLDNSLKKLNEYIKVKKTKNIKIEHSIMQYLTHKEGCKAIGVTNLSLAQAIINSYESNKQVEGGDNE